MIAATLEHVRIELENPEQLSTLLDAEVSGGWPTGEYDRDAMEFFRARLEAGGQAVEGWYGWYIIRKADALNSRALVGAGGYLGPPDADGTVEVGYSILPEWQRRGFATEIVQGFVQHAFTFAEVKRVIAHTTATNQASISVLMRCGFRAMGAGQEAGTLRFECSRNS